MLQILHTHKNIAEQEHFCKIHKCNDNLFHLRMQRICDIGFTEHVKYNKILSIRKISSSQDVFGY